MAYSVTVRAPGDHDTWRSIARQVLKRVTADPDLLDGLHFGMTSSDGPDIVSVFVGRSPETLRRYLDGAIHPSVQDAGLRAAESPIRPIWDYYVA